MDLSEYAAPHAYDTAFWMVSTTNPETSLDELGDLALSVCGKLRAAGAISLLTQGSVDGFHHNLIRSAHTWRTFLQRCRSEQGEDQHHFAAGRCGALLDACAAHQFDLALELADLAPDRFRPGHEYEDDFSFARALAALLQDPPDHDGFADLMLQFRLYLDGEASPRADVLDALARSDAESFQAAFSDLLAARELQIEESEARGLPEEPVLVTSRLIFVEGLALLAVAKRLGIAVPPDHPLCPSLAQRTMTAPFPGE